MQENADQNNSEYRHFFTQCKETFLKKLYFKNQSLSNILKSWKIRGSIFKVYSHKKCVRLDKKEFKLSNRKQNINKNRKVRKKLEFKKLKQTNKKIDQPTCGNTFLIFLVYSYRKSPRDFFFCDSSWFISQHWCFCNNAFFIPVLT